MPAKPRSNTVVNKLKTAVRNDPKRAAVLTVLVVILGVLQLRLAMKREMESAAMASSSTPVVIGSKSNNGGGTTGTTPAPKPSSSATLRGWIDSPPQPMTRNLFAIDLDHYAQDNSRPLSTNNGANEGFWDELAKSMSSRADHRKERQIFIENLQRQAAEMRLQSTVMGAKPKAVIDGALVGEGDVVAQFRVLKIEARRITVEREGIKLEIQMK
jgi:hypothetical protein